MRMIFLLAAVLLVGCAHTTPTIDASLPSLSPLAGLANPHSGTARHEGSWDRTGGNGDARPVAPGQTITLLDYKGAGIIHRFWVTIAPRAEMHIHRQAILRMYWDGETTPSVECPIGDFFGVGFGEQKDYISLPLNEISGGYNCYWPMPFHKSAKWTLENRSDNKIDAFYYNIDFTAHDSIPADVRHFHAQWRRENPTTPSRNYTILDTTGEGHVVGVALFMQARKPRDIGFLEGDEMVYIDGEVRSNLRRTRLTLSARHRRLSSPPAGISTTAPIRAVSRLHHQGRDQRPRQRLSLVYRRRHAIHQVDQGHDRARHEQRSRSRLLSVCYFYACGNVKPAPPLPADAKDLLPLPPHVTKHFPGVIEAESLRDKASVTGGQLAIQTMGSFPGDWSGEAQLFWINGKPGESLTIHLPVQNAGEYDVIAHFTKAPDYGVIRAQIGGGFMAGPIDLYDATVHPSGPISLGRAKLNAGDNPVTLTITGKNEKSTNTFIGIDAFELKPVK